MTEDRLPSAFTYVINKRADIDEIDILAKLENEYQCLVKFYEDNTGGQERDMLLYNKRSEIEQSETISELVKNAAELFYKISDSWKTYLAQNRVLSLDLSARAITLIAQSGDFWAHVRLKPDVDRGQKVIQGASAGGKKRNRNDTLIDHEKIKKELENFLDESHGKVNGKKLTKQAIAKKIAEKTGDSYKTVERVCCEELKPFTRHKNNLN
jgi:hypothetical protein